jgi:hypothetical protein
MRIIGTDYGIFHRCIPDCNSIMPLHYVSLYYKQEINMLGESFLPFDAATIDFRSGQKISVCRVSPLFFTLKKVDRASGPRRRHIR